MSSALHDGQSDPETDGRGRRCSACNVLSPVPYDNYCGTRLGAELQRRDDAIKRVAIKRVSLKYVSYEECRFCGAEAEGLIGSLALDRHKPDCIYLYIVGEK